MTATYTRSMITTKDNPFDCFDNFIEWFMFDTEKGYYSCSKLARIVQLLKGDDDNEELSEKEENEITEKAIDLLIAQDFTDTFIKVKQEYKVEMKE